GVDGLSVKLNHVVQYCHIREAVKRHSRAEQRGPSPVVPVRASTAICSCFVPLRVLPLPTRQLRDDSVPPGEIMAIQTAPSFEQLEKLKDTRDADLIGRGMLDPKRNRGRGAQTNAPSRFDTESREAVDDGWGQVEELKAFET